MGRNRKVGLDWWPRDIGLYRDPKLRAARQKFGVLGPYVYECLLDIAYGDKGYYIAYSGEGREDKPERQVDLVPPAQARTFRPGPSGPF